MSSKLDKAVLIGSLGFCFTQSMNEQESVNYITKKHGGRFKEDLIKHVFDVMSKTKKLNPGESNIISILEKEILMDELELCFKQDMTTEECVSYVTKKHCGLFEQDMIKRVFGIMSNMKKLEAVSNILYRSLKWCFDQCFTKQEMLNHMKEKHAVLYKEDQIEGLYEHMMIKHPRYQAEADSRCSFRKLLTQEHAWTRKEKVKVIDDRLSLLCQETRSLLGDFSRLEIDILGFFITKYPEEACDPYVGSGIHPMCFHCHCFHCYQRFFKIFESFSEKKKEVIDQVLKEIDVAVEDEQEEEVKNEKAGGKKAGGKKSKKNARGKKNKK